MRRFVGNITCMGMVKPPSLYSNYSDLLDPGVWVESPKSAFNAWNNSPMDSRLRGDKVDKECFGFNPTAMPRRITTLGGNGRGGSRSNMSYSGSSSRGNLNSTSSSKATHVGIPFTFGMSHGAATNIRERELASKGFISTTVDLSALTDALQDLPTRSLRPRVPPSQAQNFRSAAGVKRKPTTIGPSAYKSSSEEGMRASNKRRATGRVSGFSNSNTGNHYKFREVASTDNSIYHIPCDTNSNHPRLVCSGRGPIDYAWGTSVLRRGLRGVGSSFSSVMSKREPSEFDWRGTSTSSDALKFGGHDTFMVGEDDVDMWVM